MAAHDPTLPRARSARFFFKRQGLHLLALAILIPLACAFAADALGDGQWLGVADSTWFWLSIAVAIVHQGVVWLVWRAQLGWATLSRLFGRADILAFGLVFIPLLVSRLLFITALALSDRGSLQLPRAVAITLGVGLLLPAFYTVWSVLRYFGLIRALGTDHFRPGERSRPMVREGAFKWSNNAMYAFVFLLLWSVALLIGSQAALSAALFQHAYIWVHFYCTEEPDMDLIYGPEAEQAA